MALPRIVFHCADQNLFDSFIRGLNRTVLLEPLRKDQSLRTRHFRGYRISKDRPTTTQIAKAYHREITVTQNGELLDHLCKNWILTHSDLATKALRTLDIPDPDVNSSSRWLGLAHDALLRAGHVEATRGLVRALAFDHRIEDILIMVSIVSIKHEDQADLRQQAENEYRSVHDDPHALLKALTSQTEKQETALKNLTQELARANETGQSEVGVLQSDLKRVQAKRNRSTKLLDGYKSGLSTAQDKLETAKVAYDRAQQLVTDEKAKRRALDNSVTSCQTKIDQIAASTSSRARVLQERIAAGRQLLDDLSKQVTDAEQRIASKAESVAISVDTRDEPPQLAYTLEQLLDAVAVQGFSPSPVILHLIHRSLKGELSESPTKEPSEDPAQACSYYGHAALHNNPRWNSGDLARYALYRSMYHGTLSDSERTALVVGGIYHCGRTDDTQLLESLLGRLVWLSTEEQPQSLSASDWTGALEVIEAGLLNVDSFGWWQREVATANARALRYFYDSMSSHVRIVAKKALIAKLSGLDLQDTDPTHEVLDVVISYLETLLGPMVNCVRALRPEASLQDDVGRERQRLLAASAKLRQVFSPRANAQLVSFRDLLGPHLTSVLGDRTLDSHDRFHAVLYDYCRRDCAEPEWMSARYLFPVVVALARAASRADESIRQQKAELVASLDKQQHPLGEVRAAVPLVVRVTNCGDAPATDVHVELEADRPEVTIGRREYVAGQIRPGEVISHEALLTIAAPVSAVKLSCLFRWQDNNRTEKLEEQTLKLTAQREVDWARAGVNPYTLGSIRTGERLVGRDDDLKALEIGIRGIQSFCITGQKRVGKTSVARVLAEQFREERGFVSIYQTLGDCERSSWAGLMHSLYGAILEEVAGNAGGLASLSMVSLAEFVADPSRHSRLLRGALERELRGRKVLCVIDDFDEIGEDLYKGAGGAALFLWLRSLIDSGQFAFVLVGSERLPEVLKHQGERLNQVRQRSLDYLGDVAALRRLVVEPCAPFLEYSDAAVQKVWMFSAGNPYYATHICSRIYEDMYTKRDHYVAEADVERNVEAICRVASVNDFQHLWTDGVFDRGPDTTRTQYLNAVIEGVCAKVCQEGDEGADRDTIAAHPGLRKYDPAEVRFRLDHLVRREVLVQVGDRVRLRVPLFREWLLRGGEAAVGAAFSEEDRETRLAFGSVRPTSREVVEVVRDVVYDGRPLSEDAVRAWLQQFGIAKNQELAFLLLRKLVSIGYFDDTKIQANFRTAHRLIVEQFVSREGFSQKIEKRRTSNVFVSFLDSEGKSGPAVLYRYRNANDVPQRLVGTMEAALEFADEQTIKGRHCGVIFVDDFIGTGESCRGGLEKFGEMIAERIGARREKLVVGVAAVAGFEDGIESVGAGVGLECHVVAGSTLRREDRAFDPGAGIFENAQDRVAAERLCAAIGERLEPRQPLGFGGCQALVTFAHRCPNNTLPVFYKSGVEYNGQEWYPLFPR